MRPVIFGKYSKARSFFRACKKSIKYFKKLILEERSLYKNSVLLQKSIKTKEAHYKSRFGNKNLPIHVVFLVQFNRTWAVYNSIYEECKKDSNFKVSIVTIPMKIPAQSDDWLFNEENNSFFKNNNIDFIEGYKKNGTEEEWVDLQSLKPDVVFVQNPYDDQRHPNYRMDELNKYTQICYLQYAFIVTGGSFERHFYGTHFHKNCWKLFAETNFHKDLYKKYAPEVENKVVVSGYPKLDFYRNPPKDIDNIWKLSRKNYPHVKRIVWTPHWTIDDPNLKASNFLKYYKYFLDLVSNNSNIELVFRPHQSLFNELVQKNHMSKDELNIYIDSLNKLPNAQVDESVYYFDLFMTSDIIVVDNSSFLGEYLPTKNPIIYTHSYKNDAHNLSEYGQKLTQFHYMAHNERELNSLIERVVIKGDDYQKFDRLQNIKKYMFFPNKGSGYFIKEYLKESFGFSKE
jgi:hypothetical protein